MTACQQASPTYLTRLIGLNFPLVTVVDTVQFVAIGYAPAGNFAGSSCTPTSYKGITINLIASNAVGGGYDFGFFLGTLGAPIPQNFFTTLQVKGTSGAIFTYTSASALYTAGTPGFTGPSWTWGNGSSPIWTAPGTSLMGIDPPS